MGRLSFAVLLFVVIGAGTAPAAQAAFSFSGAFSGDDSIELFAVTLSADSTFVAQTFGYGGGTNAEGTHFAAGGFDPALALFDHDGELITAADDDTPPCSHTTPDGGNCFDSYLTDTGAFAAGTYTLALTVSGNAPGITLADFPHPPGSGNFTCADHGGPAGGVFCDVNATPRTGNWALDVSGPGVASVVDITAATPEPASIFLLCGALAGLVWRRKFRASANIGN